MVKLTIEAPIYVPGYRNSYEIEVKFMHGDARSYTTEKAIIPAVKLEYAEEILIALNKLKNLPWNDARELYDQQIEFKKWFGGEYLGAVDDEPAYDEDWPAELTLEIWDELYPYSFEWPKDVTYRDVLARLNDFKVFYYDENGIKRSVKIEF